MLQDILLRRLGLEDNIERERLQSPLSFVNLESSKMKNTVSLCLCLTYPDLTFSWELNDPLIIGPLFLLTDGSDSDDDVDVVSVTVGAGVVALRLQGAVHGLAKGGRTSGAGNEEIN